MLCTTSAEMIPIEPEPGNAGEGNKQSADVSAAAPTPGATARSIFYAIIFLKTVLLAGAALLALAAAPAWAQGPVSGTVADARTGEALPGATILLDGAAGPVTDASGTFTLPVVPAGTHEIRISFLGYEPVVRQVQGQDGEQQLNSVLQPGAVLTGEALVTASLASDRTATAYTNLGKEDL